MMPTTWSWAAPLPDGEARGTHTANEITRPTKGQRPLPNLRRREAAARAQRFRLLATRESCFDLFEVRPMPEGRARTWLLGAKC